MRGKGVRPPGLLDAIVVPLPAPLKAMSRKARLAVEPRLPATSFSGCADRKQLGIVDHPIAAQFPASSPAPARRQEETLLFPCQALWDRRLRVAAFITLQSCDSVLRTCARQPVEHNPPGRARETKLASSADQRADRLEIRFEQLILRRLRATTNRRSMRWDRRANSLLARRGLRTQT